MSDSRDSPRGRAEFLSVGEADVALRAEMAPPPTPFPARGMPQDDVLRLVERRLSQNADPQRNWTVYGAECHPFARRVIDETDALNSYTVEFLRQVYPGTAGASQEAVRMIGALLGADDPYGFITTGGTESNLLAMRLARNLSGSISKPEIIAPQTRHYSFDLAAELFGMTVRVVDVSEDYKPDMSQVRDLITDKTVALVCSAPEGELGTIDPVADFGRIAADHGLFLHVDAAVGGFMLPFKEMLGWEVPSFDFRVPAVMSMSADAHKLGLCPRPTGSLILRRGSDLKTGVPIDQVVIDTLSASGRSGASSVAAWAMFKHLGAEGYKELVHHQIELTGLLADGIRGMTGLALIGEADIPMVCFTTTDGVDIEELSRLLWERGFIIPLNVLEPYGTLYLRIIVHPLKRRASAELLLEALDAAVGDLQRGRRATVHRPVRIW
jgi:tyrosine decarboxylase/aspartate 1-decarboxylase